MKKRVCTLFGMALLCPVLLCAQARVDTIGPWIRGGFSSLNFNQVSLTNWAAGGQSSLSVSGLFNAFANYKNADSTTRWENALDLGFGLIKQQDERLQKNDDRLEFNSKYGKLAGGKFYYTGLLNFRTQFAEGFNFPNDTVVTSRFFSPAFLTVALGMEYKPNDYFSVFLSPATGKFTFVRDQTLANQGAFGVDPAVFDPNGVLLEEGRRFRAEFGASLVAKFQKDIFENVNLVSKLTLFNNYTDKNTPNRRNIDVNFESLVGMKINRFLAASLFVNLIYDDDINIPTIEERNGEQVEVGTGPKTQFKEAFGLGFSYKF